VLLWRKLSLISIWPYLYPNATKEILSVLNRKFYAEGLKTLGKWLSGDERLEAKGCKAVIFSMISVSRRPKKQRKRYSDESQ